MPSRVEGLQKEVKRLLGKGQRLYWALADACEELPEDFKKELEDKEIELPSFATDYEPWYSEALRVIAQVIPDRTEDFTRLYKNDRRKSIDFSTYCLSDALLGLQTSRYGEVIANRRAAIPKLQIQVSILQAAENRFKSRLFDISEVLQADIFDSELDAARELNKKGFVRAGGAIAGVVLEKHLGHACANHQLKSRKKRLTISDYNDMLKEAEVIDVSRWRFIQHLGDLRNLCDHHKERDPERNDVQELIEGVEKVIKTVF